MSDKKDKTRQSDGVDYRSSPKKFRDSVIRSKAAQGMTATEIATSMNIGRQTVSKVLNSKETKELLKNANDRLLRMVGTALDTLEDAMEARHEEGGMNPAVQVATKVLKSLNVLKDKVDLDHHFPKPTIIVRRDGTRIELGSSTEEEGEIIDE